MEEDEVIIAVVHRKVWKPSRSKTLVVSLPEVPFMREGDRIKVMATSKQRIIIERESSLAGRISGAI